MNKKSLPLILAFSVALFCSSCELFEKEQQKASEPNDEEPFNMEVYAEQAQNVLLQIWNKTNDEASLEPGRVESDSVEIDSLIEVCGLKGTLSSASGRVSDGQVRSVLTVNFTSFRCEYNTVVRQGQVKLELLSGTSIAQKNSVAKFIFNDFKVTHVETGKYVIYNGTKIITNLSGGTLTNLTANQPELIHKVRSNNFHIFYSGSSGDIIKNTARYKKFSKLDIGNNYEMTTYGDTTINGITNVADWGTLRNGKTFYHIIKKAIVYETCSRHCKYTRGERVQKVVGGREMTTIFGVNKFGAKNQNCSAFGKLMYYFDAQGDSIGTVIKYF